MKGDENFNNAKQLQEEIDRIDNYLAGKGVTAIKDPTGIRLVISKLGTGFPAKRTSSVSVDYIGRLFPDGAVFDEGNAKGTAGSTFIVGWRVVLGLLPEGSRARVYIPSEYAYREPGLGSIPSNATLEFDMYFDELTRTSVERQRLGADTIAIDNYLVEKGIEAEKDSTGMRYVITQSGGGPIPGLYQKLKFFISYRLLTDDSKVVAEFDFAPVEGFDSRAVDQIADGVKRALSSFPVGSKVTLYLPSPLAFGQEGAKDGDGGSTVVPTNAVVIVNIELKEIVTP
jgi:FKBP-type peptidyl-prolyl cis-trans isomerase